MNIIEKNISEIIPYINNPRKNDKAVKYVVNSIKEFGFRIPIIIDKNNVVVCGHTRLKAAKELKMKTVPCIMADDLSEQQIKAFRLADNKVSEIADWDMEKLEQEMLGIFDLNMSDFGFSFADEMAQIEEMDDEVVPKKVEYKTEKGQLWKLGDHLLLCGDSTDEANYKRLMGDEKAEMIFTDPPYNVDYDPHSKPYSQNVKTTKIANDNKKSDDFRKFLELCFKNMFKYTSDGGAAYICHAQTECVDFITAFKAAGFDHKETLIWCKNFFVIGRQDFHWEHEPILYGWKPGASHRWYGGRKQGTLVNEDFPVEIGMDVDGGNIINVHIGKKRVVLKAPSVEVLDIDDESTLIFVDRPQRNEDHPTMKPILLVAKCIRNNSKKGQIVLDPFGGSGSTLMACEKMGRKCRTMELEPKYCDVIIKRWEDYTGQKAIKI